MFDPGWLRDTLSMVVTFGLTGWLLSLILFAGGVGTTERTWLSLALSVPATILAATPALLFRRLSGAGFAVGLTVLCVVAVWRSRGVRVRVTRDWTQLWSRVRRLSYQHLFVLVGMAVVCWLAVLGPQLAIRRPDLLPNNAFVWYYWWLTELVAAQGAVPNTIMEWGAPRPFPYEYLYHTLHSAITAQLAGGADLLFMERYRFLLVGLALLAAYALWRRWLPLWWAWLAAILTLASSRYSFKFAAYWPENLALVLVFWSGWLFDEALERRSERWAAVAALVSASAYLAHAEIWLLTIPMWAGIVAGRFLPYLWLRAKQRTENGAHERHPFRPTLYGRFFTILVLAFGLIVLSTGITLGGGGRLSHITTEVASQSGKQTQVGQDPTWALHTAIGFSNPRSQPPDVCNLFRSPYTRVPFLGLDTRTATARTLLAGSLLLFLVSLPRLPSSTRRVGITWLVYVVGVYAGGSTFCLVYDTYVPERAGYLRIMPNYVVALAGLIAVSGWVASRGISALVLRVLPDPGLKRVVNVIATILVSSVLLYGLTPLNSKHRVGPLSSVSPSTYRALSWMDNNLPKDAVVLMNGFTVGTVGGAGGRTGLLDGRAPYLEDLRWREEARRTLLQSRKYFRNPEANATDLPAGVSHILVAGPGIGVGGTRFGTNIPSMRRAPNLRLIRNFEGGKLLLFEVLSEEHGQNTVRDKWLAKSTLDTPSMSPRFGHSSLATTQRYTRIKDAYLRESYEPFIPPSLRKPSSSRRATLSTCPY